MDSARYDDTTRAPEENRTPPDPAKNRDQRAEGDAFRRRDRSHREYAYKSPTLAGFLSMMPGLGQIYVGYYQQGFINVGIIAGTIALLASNSLRGLEPLLGIFLGFFWFYNIIDAARRAQAYNRAIDGLGPDELPEEVALPVQGSPRTWGIVLVVVGLILFADTKFGFSLDWLEEWWPLIPVAFGVYLIRKGRS